MTERRDHPNINRYVHPPLVMLIHLLAAVFVNGLLPLPVAFPKSLDWAGYILVFVGFGFAFSAMSQFGRMHTTLDPHGSVSAIVMSGPYRFSRNPIYLGFVFTLVGLPLALGNVWGVALSPLLMASLYLLVIKHEEAYLEEKFKDVYTSYKSRVRRWL